MNSFDLSQNVGGDSEKRTFKEQKKGRVASVSSCVSGHSCAIIVKSSLGFLDDLELITVTVFVFK